MNPRLWIVSMAQGGAVTACEPSPAWTNGEPNDNHASYLLPFLRAVVRHRLIPAREELARSIRLMVDPEPSRYDPMARHNFTYGGGPYLELYRKGNHLAWVTEDP